jgi:hypothetical protein
MKQFRAVLSLMILLALSHVCEAARLPGPPQDKTRAGRGGEASRPSEQKRPGGVNEQARGEAPPCRTQPRFEGTVIQPELVQSWTVEQWKREFKYMTDACIGTVLLQYTTTYEGKAAFYPTGMRGYTPAQGSAEMLDRLFKAADESGVSVYLGLQYRKSFSGAVLPPRWDTEEAGVNNTIADELWDRYARQPAFGRRFKGWYVPLEVENFSYRTPVAQDQLTNFYRLVAEHLHTKSRGLSVVTAPFFNTHGGQDSAAWREMWTKVLVGAPLDVLALQDSVGPLTDDSGHQTHHATTQQLPEWFGATRAAVDEARRQTGRRIQFWADTETYSEDYSTHQAFDPFTICPAASAAPQSLMVPLAVGRIVEDMRAVKSYVDGYVAFSFNHYMSPQQQREIYYQAYARYVSTGEVDQSPPTAPAGLTAQAEGYNSVRLAWSPSSDDLGVAGYVIYRDDKLLRTVYLSGAESCTGFHDHDDVLTKGTAYRYKVAAFDGAGNLSAASGAVEATTSSQNDELQISSSKPYTASVPAMAPYIDPGTALTDTILGDESLYDCWQGRQTDQPYTFTVDLGGEFDLTEVNSDWLQKKKDSVYLPKRVRYQVSLDGKEFRDAGEVARPVDSDCVQAVKYSLQGLKGVTARHVRMIVEPDRGWTMTSEFQIFGTPKS